MLKSGKWEDKRPLMASDLHREFWCLSLWGFLLCFVFLKMELSLKLIAKPREGPQNLNIIKLILAPWRRPEHSITLAHGPWVHGMPCSFSLAHSAPWMIASLSISLLMPTQLPHFDHAPIHTESFPGSQTRNMAAIESNNDLFVINLINISESFCISMTICTTGL